LTHSVPVLMYHHINPHRGDIVTVTPEVFEAQMKYLADEGYRTLKLDELVSFIMGELTPDSKSVVVTFDDGWLDNYIYAYPVLRKYKINTAIFLITDRVEKASENINTITEQIPSHNESKEFIVKGDAHKVVMGWKLIKEMQQSGIIEFYPHTKSHKRCGELKDYELLDEMRGSKDMIERRLGLPLPYFCWPYGSYNEDSIKAAIDAGFKALFTTDDGFTEQGSDPFRIKRIDVRDDLPWFKSLLL
jgi:peptidoglycan/xylan/chitin deacetylase (PgdA/CDA1 family)